VETRSLLIGEAASPAAQRRIADALASSAGIVRVVHVVTLHLGPEELLVGAKVTVVATSPAVDVVATIDAAEAAIRRAEPMARVVYVEPAVEPDAGR
jgi:divalent metal cation (Fe/Co/Zn/Cd) transporter